MEWNANGTWYHGSPSRLTSIRPGSTITQDPELARIFSHKPTLVSQNMDDDGRRTIKHTGKEAGFLYRIDRQLQPEDIYPHPQTTMALGQEWLTTCELPVVLLESTQVIADEVLTPAEIEQVSAFLNREKP